MFKRLIVIILLLSFLFVNCFAVVAYADLWDGLKYSITSLWDGSFFMDPAGSVVNYWKEVFGVEDAESYDAYVAENYPANMYSSDGKLLYQTSFIDLFIKKISVFVGGSGFNLSNIGFHGDGVYSLNENLSLTVYNSSSYSFSCRGSSVVQFSSLSGVSFLFSDFLPSSIIPYVSGVYRGLVYYLGNSVPFIVPTTLRSSWLEFDYLSYGAYSFITVVSPILVIDPSISHDTNLYVHNTRVGSVNFNLATKQGDTVTNVYQNVTIVDEDTNIYTDPTTGEQKNINSWTYDYSTRTYHLTLEDGSLLDVEFGEDSIKVKLNGELTQEYYYTVENEEPEPSPSPEPTATPEPTPTPTPGGGGEEPPPTAAPEPTPDPGTGGEDEPPDGFFEWLKQWLIDFKEWLGDWLDKLFNKDVTIDESDNSVHIEDNDDIDYDIYYSDDQGEQQQTSLRDILHKFGFLHDIYDLGRDMFTIVGADAAAAYAYDPGGTIDITPYLGDLRTVDAADIMPIAGAPSLKLDLGAAQSHYGYEYGGEVEFLDLSWYTPYKQTVDSLLSGFLWLMFIWRLFKVAPGIVSGAGMVTDKAEDIHDGKKR